ncbi:hypothetical protein TURU_088121 [Turdus rufiventris]|nr:hypothetical protein TURU_088121 [Turdus rufiventris]
MQKDATAEEDDSGQFQRGAEAQSQRSTGQGQRAGEWFWARVLLPLKEETCKQQGAAEEMTALPKFMPDGDLSFAVTPEPHYLFLVIRQQPLINCRSGKLPSFHEVKAPRWPCFKVLYTHFIRNGFCLYPNGNSGETSASCSLFGNPSLQSVF